MQLTHCIWTVHIQNAIQLSDKESMPLTTVFSREVLNNQTLQQQKDIFPLSLGLWAAMIELSVTVGHAIACLISRKIELLSSLSFFKL